MGIFSPTSRYGTADDFKYFVDQCHQAGISIILDWGPAHFPSDAHGLARFDGTPLYEYEDPRRGWHQDWNSYIYDFGSDTVRQFLVVSALFWFDKFHIDGLPFLPDDIKRQVAVGRAHSLKLLERVVLASTAEDAQPLLQELLPASGEEMAATSITDACKA